MSVNSFRTESVAVFANVLNLRGFSFHDSRCDFLTIDKKLASKPERRTCEALKNERPNIWQKVAESCREERNKKRKNEDEEIS